MKKVAALHLSARTGRRPLKGGIEASLKPLKERKQLHTLVKLTFPSLDDDTLNQIWSFIEFLLESYPVKDSLEFEVSWEEGRIGLDAGIWKSLSPTQVSLQEDSMPYERFEMAMGLAFPEVPREVISSLWMGVQSLINALEGAGYPYGSLKVEVEKEGDE